MTQTLVIPTGSPAPVAGEDARSRCAVWYAAHRRAICRYLRFQVDSTDTADDLAAADDGALVLGLPAGDVVMAAILETGHSPPSAPLR